MGGHFGKLGGHFGKPFLGGQFGRPVWEAIFGGPWPGLGVKQERRTNPQEREAGQKKKKNPARACSIKEMKNHRSAKQKRSRTKPREREAEQQTNKPTGA